MSETTVGIQRQLDLLRSGDRNARDHLLAFAFQRLERMTRKMLRQYDRLARWEQTDDVLQNASLRLLQALDQVEVEDPRHFFRLAALQIRRELIDLCRRYQGPQGMGANHRTQLPAASPDATAPPPLYDRADQTTDPRKMQEWSEFHAAVQELPDRERETMDLLWYHELSQDEAAEVLGLSTRQVKRLWRSAKLLLHDRLQGAVPSDV